MQDYNVSRLAVLIGAPGKENNYLRGVSADLSNLRNFLLSPNGGRFYPSEIISLPRAELSDVVSVIQGVQVDYLFVYFSGHGYTERFSNRRMLSLQDYHVEDLFLLNRSPRQLVIADACRNFTGAAISGIPQFGEEPDHFDGESEVRNLFNKLILQSPAGRMIIHGTQHGHYSSDSSSGGYFTRALLHVGTNIKAEQTYSWTSIENVLHYVPSVLNRNNNFQLPEITYKTGNLKVPFAIGVPKPKYRTIDQAPLMQHRSKMNWGQMGLGLLLLAAIGYSLSD
jgi:hypothetical protein